MDLFNSLRVFVKVVDVGSFTAAAHLLNLSPSQVSRLVADLEGQLQARLLQRNTRKISVTDVGERFIPRARQILAEMETATNEARGAHLKPHGRLRLHSMNGIGMVITPLIARYCELYPDVIFELTLSQREPDLLEDGQDVVISIAQTLPDSEFVAQSVGEIYSVPCASPGYIARHGRPAKPSDLQEHRCLRMIDPLFGEAWHFKDGSDEYKMLPGMTFKSNVAEVMVNASQAGMGISLLPFFTISAALLDGTLVRLLPEYRLRHRSVYAVYPSRRFLDAKVRTWIEFLKKELPLQLALHEAALGQAGNLR